MLSLGAVLLVYGTKVPTRPTPRVVGGTPATQFEYPFLARIYGYISTSNSGFCGGTLISNEWVLSAAHCFWQRDASSIYVGVHRHSIWSGSTSEHACAEIIPAAEVHCHPSYNNNAAIGNDICLVRLQRSVSCRHVPKIRLDDGLAWPMDSASPYNSARANIVGWGVTAPGGSSVSEVPMEAELNLYTRDQCRTFFTGGSEVSLLTAFHPSRAHHECACRFLARRAGHHSSSRKPTEACSAPEDVRSAYGTICQKSQRHSIRADANPCFVCVRSRDERHRLMQWR